MFTAQGMKNPSPRMRMLDGFNDGWIEFEGGEGRSRKGSVPLMAALKDVVAGTGSRSPPHASPRSVRRSMMSQSKVWLITGCSAV